MTKLFDRLVPLQEMDLKIHDLREQRQEKPRELASVQEKLDHAKNSHQQLQDEIKQLTKEQHERELEVKEFDGKIEKLTVQSNTAKKNEEYQAFLKDISGCKADRSRVEDAFLDLDMQIEEKRKLETIRKDEVAVAEAEFAKEKKRIEEEMGGLDRDIEGMLDQRRGLTDGVDREILTEYERILNAKDDGLALAALQTKDIIDESGKVTQYICQGCVMQVTSQDVNRILMARELVRCRACSRILHLAKKD